MGVNKEIASHVDVIQCLEADISTDTTTAGTIIDTAGYDGGVFFAMGASAYTDGTFTMKIEEGDESDLSDASVVDDDNRVYQGTINPAVSAVTADGTILSKQGVFNTKRYVRLSVVSTSTTHGSSLYAIAVCSAEVLPTDQTP